ncbi:unnamed protein product [Rangifer tarandus platyrhynchus]|uniref:Uncharacterized protein n=1 Tax=Rangifer tarandus platyrhynchus TaxID=3082113 RepID=A0ABN9A0X4_RANTA|nr:unnamed protein product [Rangifer tarandus platyrhynchus]
MLTRDPPANRTILRSSPVAVSSLAVERDEGAGSHQLARRAATKGPRVWMKEPDEVEAAELGGVKSK